ncbi:hypothetical protein C1H46_038868 [Malus baccata]|uniref:Adenosine deaminase domain-containing protein n=1 Tax=Malus baccata TaxID=106549 RepID=A0A540KMW9_MALBA|nr:hypothetical protein C1H46_038868 [Malus baccata]
MVTFEFGLSLLPTIPCRYLILHFPPTQVIEDFASENVVYLELRTTPKNNASIGMSKRSYLEAVLEGVRAVSAVDVAFRPQSSDVGSQKNSSLINHTCSGSARKKIYVKLALEMRDLGVVGIDLSGNPIVGEWVTFFPALKFAREQGLYVTLHCGEVPNPKEIRAMLDFQPQRIGHACCFEEEEWKTLKSLSIPVEICLTSNIRTNTIPSLDVHHFADLYNAKHPLVICTDDSGVFSTSLSNEYNLAAAAFGLGKRELFQLARNSIDFVFADDGVKRELKEIVNSAEKKLDL